jgi:hypothetical protein
MKEILFWMLFFLILNLLGMMAFVGMPLNW